MNWTEAVAWALIHSIWQGVTLAFVAAAALSLLPRSPRARHGVAMLALVGMPAAFAWTLFQAFGAVPGPVAALPSLALRSSEVAPWTSWLVGAWSVGVSLFGARLLLGWRRSRTLRADAVAAPEAVVEALAKVAERLGMNTIPARSSAAVDGPQVVGVLRPMLLVPATMMNLTPAQLEAVLAHELLHVRHGDPIFLIAQEAIQAAFFFHPAAWWLAGVASREREHACDDGAAAITGRTTMARALLELEEQRLDGLALAAGGPATARIRRLVSPPPVRRSGSSAVALMLALALTLLGGQAIASDDKARAAFEAIQTEVADYLELDVIVDPAALEAMERPDQDDAIRGMLRAKAAALRGVEEKVTALVEGGSPEWGVAALAQLGSAYEDMADALTSSSIPTYLNEDQVSVYRRAIEKKADPQREKAIEAYVECLQTALLHDIQGEWVDEATARLAALE